MFHSILLKFHLKNFPLRLSRLQIFLQLASFTSQSIHLRRETISKNKEKLSIKSLTSASSNELRTVSDFLLACCECIDDDGGLVLQER